MKRTPSLFLALSLAAIAAVAQNPQPPAGAAIPTVKFDVFWEPATPQQYTITVQANGETKYVSHNPTKPGEENGVQGDDFETEFTLSDATRDKIFAMAEQARYFDGEFDYKKHSVANTGRKTLTYSDSNRHFATTYNWSENAAVDQLTRMFQGISNVIEHGNKIQFLRRFANLVLAPDPKALKH